MVRFGLAEMDRFLIPSMEAPVIMTNSFPINQSGNQQQLNSSGKQEIDDSLRAGLKACDVVKSWASTEHEGWDSQVEALERQLQTTHFQLQQKHRYSELGQATTHLAHEIRKNLLPVNLHLKLLREQVLGNEQSEQLLDKVDAGMFSLETTLNDLIHFAAPSEPHWEPLRVKEVLNTVIDRFQSRLRIQNIQLDVDVDVDTVIRADRELLKRAMVNLISNALEVMPEGGDLVITSYAGTNSFELEIADSGPGLDKEQRHQVFQPFYSTKGNGIGLGLAIVSKIAELHGGDVQILNCADGGAAFTLRFPQQTQYQRAAA